MVVVRYGETYDLSTTIGKIGLIAIHTPSVQRIDSLWSGLRANHRFMRILGCDVHLACASLMPADPLQIGESGSVIAPQDMFNPILYKAVTNESFDTLVARGLTTAVGDQPSIAHYDDILGSNSGSGVHENIYYGLLNTPGWKKAVPQQGLDMIHLRPLVHEVVNTFGNETMPSTPQNLNAVQAVIPGTDSGTGADALGTTVLTKNYSTFRGSARPMPRIPTYTGMVSTPAGGTYPLAGDLIIPQCYVGVVLLPPALLHKMYFRLRVVWYIEFQEVMPLNERGTQSSMAYVGTQTYARSYVIQNAKSELSEDYSDNIKEESSVDTFNMDVKQVI